VYFTAAETDCDTQALALAYLETLMASYPRVGVFRSFTNGAIDDDAAFLELLAKAGRSQDAERAWGSTRETYVASEEDAMNAIVQRFTEYAKDFDAVLVTGLLDGDPVLPGSLDRAGRAAANLGTTVVMAVSGASRTGRQVAATATLAAAEISKEHAPISATVVVDAPDDARERLEGFPSPLVFFSSGAGESASDRGPGLSDGNARILLEAMAHGSDVVTPLSFTAALVEKARSDRMRIVLPESDDDRILRAAAECLQRGVADIVLLGEADAVEARAVPVDFFAVYHKDLRAFVVFNTMLLYRIAPFLSNGRGRPLAFFENI